VTAAIIPQLGGCVKRSSSSPAEEPGEQRSMNERGNSRESAMLILQRGGEAGVTWPLEHRMVTIGRGEDCDIVLDDRQISRIHARVVWRADHYEIEDLNSKNGTHLNGRDVTSPQPLRDGDEIQIALRYKLAFVDAGATAPLSFEGPSERGLRLDSATHQVHINGKLLEPPLSAQQYRLLELLMSTPGVVLRDDVVPAVWPDAIDGGVSEQSIDALVRRLRDRLTETDAEHQYIVTMRGHGFRFENRS
jgi:pSer/pThr/pTyr-binding forkhead associated (FHA) protein